MTHTANSVRCEVFVAGPVTLMFTLWAISNFGQSSEGQISSILSFSKARMAGERAQIHRSSCLVERKMEILISWPKFGQIKDDDKKIFWEHRFRSGLKTIPINMIV